jgi:hypothetical protein
MKDFLPTTYIFVPGTSGVGTVTLNIPNFDPKRLVAIINQTRGVVMYATGSIDTRYTAILNNILTLNVDTSTHNAGDILQIVYNDINPLSVALDDLSVWFRSILKAVQYPNFLDRGSNAIRATVTALPTLATVTTVGTVTTQTNIGNFNADIQVRALSRSAWYSSVRPRIT